MEPDQSKIIQDDFAWQTNRLLLITSKVHAFDVVLFTARAGNSETGPGPTNVRALPQPGEDGLLKHMDRSTMYVRSSSDESCALVARRDHVR